MENDAEKLSDKQIEDKAVETLKEHGLYEYPVDVRRLAKKLNIAIYSADFENKAVCGVIRKEGKGWAIYYNRENHPNRVRFTIAHEIGHYALKHLKKPEGITDEQLDMYRRVDSEKEPGYRMEVEANKFAAALLMPREFVLDVWVKCNGDIESMAEEFNVSALAMGYRADHVDRF